MSILRVVNKYKFGEEPKDLSFWKSKSYQERIDALEQIHQEYNQWRYPTQPRIQKVYKIVKLK